MHNSASAKQTLAKAMKQLMEIYPFEKISVTQICERSHLSRKSFYYNFGDKYELVNWIFDTEFLNRNQPHTFEEHWGFLHALVSYLHANKTFYLKALQVNDIHSFRNHFAKRVKPYYRQFLEDLFAKADFEMINDEKKEVYAYFLADAYLSSVEKWLASCEGQTVDEYIDRMRLF